MEITYSAFNNPNVWYEPDCGVIHFASDEDAKRAKELLEKVQAEAYKRGWDECYDLSGED